MIDLYKQTEHHKSSLRHYAPVHIAAVLSILFLSLSFVIPGGPQLIPLEKDDQLISAIDDIPGEGLDNAILVSKDLRPDDTVIPSDKLFWQDSSDEVVLDQLLLRMSPEEMVSQLFLLGWDSENAEGPIMDWISERGLGGVKIFGWNGNNVGKLSRSLSIMQETALLGKFAIPLFTATDQEGGWVRHIKDTTSITPGNMAIGASALPMDSYLSGFYIGQQLRAIGVNMNFAPTVDVYVNKEAHVIGPRAFSSDPLETAILGIAFFQGMQQAAVIATAKHFPGHGNALGDSHGYMPVINDDFDTVWNRDLLPYRMMIPEGLPAVLSGHLNFPKITDNDAPASLTPFFKQEILRKRLDFQGIVITDDLYMGGATNYGDRQGWDMAHIVLEAIKAGNDMVMLSRTPAVNDEIWTLLLDSYEKDPAFKARVQEAVRRILKLKLMYLKPSWRVPLTTDPETVYKDIQDYNGEPFFQEQAARGVTLIRKGNIPFIPEGNEKVLLVGQDMDFLREGRKTYPGAGQYYFDYSPFYSADPQTISDLKKLIPRYDTVIFNLTNPNSLEVLSHFSDYADRIIVFSILTPVYLDDLPWVKSAIAVYGWGVESFTAGFAALHGDIPIVGQLPVPIEGEAED